MPSSLEFLHLDSWLVNAGTLSFPTWGRCTCVHLQCGPYVKQGLNLQTKRFPRTSCPHLREPQVEFPSPTPEELAAYAAARESQASMHQSMAAQGGNNGALSSSRMGSIDMAD